VRGFLYPVGSGSAINVISADNAQSTTAVGVGYRTDVNQTPAQQQLIIAGNTTSGVAEWMTADGGVTFANKRRNANWTYGQTISAVNQLGSDGTSDTYYVTSRSSAQSSLLVIGKGTNKWNLIVGVETNTALMDYDEKGISGDRGAMNGIGASGRAVGWRGSNTTQANRRNYRLDYPGLIAAFFNGLDGTDSGEAWSVSADGNTVFGRSKTASDPNNYYGYKTTFSNTPPSNNGTTQGSVNALPEFSDTGGSVSRGIPYGCTPDGRYAVGMNYRGSEKAVVWNTTDPDPTKWTVLDLTDLAVNNGFAGSFTRMSRAYSAGISAAGDLVITGVGAAGATRGYVMTVPEWIAQLGLPENQSVNAGANVTIGLKTNGTDSLSFQWFKNGSELPGATSTSLAYNNVTCASGDAGTYSVFVTNNAIPEVIKGQMVLTVLDPAITQQPLNQTNRGWTTASFTVTATGAPTLSYQWKRGGIDLSDGPTGWGSTIAGASTSALSIANLQAADEGSYSVVVTTSAGGCTATSLSRYLAVLPAQPRFTSIVANPGGSYTLTFLGWINETWYLYYSTSITAPLQTPDWTYTGQWGVFDGVTPVVYQDVTPGDVQRFYLLANPELPAAE